MHHVQGLDNWLDLLPPKVRKAIEHSLRPRTFEDGEGIYAIGDPGSDCYFISHGHVRILDYSSSGKEFQVMNLRSGASFGETSLIDGLPRSDNAYAGGETEILLLGRRNFERLSAKHREISEALNVHLCYRLRFASSAVKDASVLALRDRIPRLLTRLVYSHGLREASGRFRIEGVSHQDIANMLGVTRQSVSRELKELERAGLIDLHYRAIVLPHLAALATRFDSLLGGEPLGSEGRG